MSIIGSLSNNGGGSGYENVTKVKSNCFKLNRAYPILFNSSNVDNFFLEWNSNTLPSKFRKRKRKSLSCVHVLHVKLKSNPIDFFCSSRWRRRRRCLSSLMTVVIYSILTYWVQWPFQDNRSFYSCGFCTPGFVLGCDWPCLIHNFFFSFGNYAWKTTVSKRTT